MLKKIHDSLGVGGIKNLFNLENPKLNNEELQILKGIELDLKKRGKCMDDITQAFDTQNPKWTPENMTNVKGIMGLVGCQRYKIEEKVTKIKLTMWSQEQSAIRATQAAVVEAVREATRLVNQELVQRPTGAPQ